MALVVAASICLTAATCSKNGGAPSSSKEPAPVEKPAPAGAAPAAAPAETGKGEDYRRVLAGVPGMDFSQLPAPAQRELATVFTDEFCYCGCPHTLGGCLKQHEIC